MRLNKFIAAATGMSRRAADAAIASGRVTVGGATPDAGAQVGTSDSVYLDGKKLHIPETSPTTLLLNKPAGYVCSRNGQGSRTVYDLLPEQYRRLKTVGRLDKDSSGLLLLTDDGELTHRLTHPSFQKTKVYEVTLDIPLQPLHRQLISDHGVQLDDGNSRLELERLQEGSDTAWRVRMHEGRNRQIRRTFAALGYQVVRLHRIQFGEYALGDLDPGSFRSV